MRKFLFWYLPVGVALIATVVFAGGFYAYLRGNLGTPIDEMPSRRVSAQAPRGEIAPLILGDSLARGTGDESGLGIGGRLAEELRRRGLRVKQPVNLAVNGAHTGDLLQQLESRNVRLLVAQSNVVIVSIGGNDLWGGGEGRAAPPRDPESVMDEVIARIDRVVRILRKANPSARIYLIGLYNPFLSAPFGRQLSGLVSRWNGRLLERFGADPNFTLVPVSDLFAYRDRLSFDRFHPNEEGYALIARRIAETI